MKKSATLKYYFLSFFILVCCTNSSAQNPVNWTAEQLTEPSALAETLKNNKDVPVIFCIGPGAVIPNSINIGMVNDENNFQKFKEEITRLPKSTNILIYCGCCPFEHCPNVRPAVALLKSLEFTNYHLLDLPHNLKTDWIAKGYPVSN